MTRGAEHDPGQWGHRGNRSWSTVHASENRLRREALREGTPRSLNRESSEGARWRTYRLLVAVATPGARTISIRRLRLRFSGESLGAMGWYWP